MGREKTLDKIEGLNMIPDYIIFSKEDKFTLNKC